jgi:hypothetical protein
VFARLSIFIQKNSDMAENIPLLVQNDEWLSPFSKVIEGRIEESEKRRRSWWEMEILLISPLAIFISGYTEPKQAGFYGSGCPMPCLFI